MLVSMAMTVVAVVVADAVCAGGAAVSLALLHSSQSLATISSRVYRVVMLIQGAARVQFSGLRD